MFRNYLTVAIRSFLNRKLYSFINIAGLAVSLACAIFITLFIRDELSYDAWEPASANVYQVTAHFNVGDKEALSGWFIDSPWPVGRTMHEEMHGIAADTSTKSQRATVKSGNHLFNAQITFARKNFFQVIRLPFYRGNAATALAHPDALVLTRRAAQKYFGTDNALGRTLTIAGSASFKVSAILENPPENTQFDSDIYISDTAGIVREKYKWLAHNWFSISSKNYVRLTDGVSPAEIERQIPEITRKYADPRKLTNINLTGDQFLKMGLIRLRNVHLQSSEGTVNSGGRTMVRGFAAIALMLLAIAAFNFTNLSTAIATMRAREVALRKTVGATRRQLMGQFLTESVLTACVALIVALAAVELLLPAFNGFLGREISFSYIGDFPVLAAAIAMALVCGVIGGLYPALVLSGFRPSLVLKSGHGASGGSGRFRAALVILQFAISIGLGIAALTVFSQINYARNIDLGYSHDNIVIISNADHLKAAQIEGLSKRLAQSPWIVRVAQSNSYPMGGSNSSTQVRAAGAQGDKIVGRIIYVDPAYLPTYGMKLIAGRNFDRRHGKDMMSPQASENDFEGGKNVIIDSRIAQKLGFTPKEAIGKTLITGMTTHEPEQVIGVVSFARYSGVQGKSAPVIYAWASDSFNTLSLRVRGGHVREALAAIDRDWKAVAPNTAIRRHFLSDSFDEQFESINRQAILFTVFVIVAIFTACLGLFGLAAFTTERRKKEISVRKVFGASKVQIIRLLLWRFSVPVLIANVIAWPLAYLWLHHWLEGYAYHIHLSPLYFIISGVTALAIAGLTISANAFKTASVPPAHALRTE